MAGSFTSSSSSALALLPPPPAATLLLLLLLLLLHSTLPSKDVSIGDASGADIDDDIDNDDDDDDDENDDDDGGLSAGGDIDADAPGFAMPPMRSVDDAEMLRRGAGGHIPLPLARESGERGELGCGGILWLWLSMLLLLLLLLLLLPG